MGIRCRLAAGGVLLASLLCAAPPEIGDVGLRAVGPWKGIVEISYRTSGDFVATRPNARFLQTVTIRDEEGGCAPVVLTNNLAETSLFPRNPSFEPGEHRIVWSPADPASVPARVSVEIEVRETTTPETYCVVDLSGGERAASHPVMYMSAVPGGAWTDEFKTDYLVLRLVEPGSFTMGDQVHGGPVYPDITLTQPYYIGVFETTQRQWELMGGSAESAYTNGQDRATHPVENVSLVQLRGDDWGFWWPEPEAANVDPGSILYGLQRRSGLRLDLPTEAQWEFACRAGTTTDYGNGTDYSGSGYADSAMDAVGRYAYSPGGMGGQTAPVGSYAPNGWGVFDMHGNVQELCLDRWRADGIASPAVDPKGPSEEDGAGEGVHVARGGHLDSMAEDCTSSSREFQEALLANGYTGFRLACPAPAAYEGRICSAASRPTRLGLSEQEDFLTVGAAPVPIEFDPLYSGVDPAAGDYVVRVTLDGVETLVETNGGGRLEGWTAHWYTNVLRHVVLRGGVEVGTPLERHIVSRLGPESMTLAECVNVPALTFTAGGTGGWSRDTVTNMDEVVSLRSRDTGLEGETWLETRVVGPGTLSFWWKVEGEQLLDKRGNPIALYDYVSLDVDGREEKSLGVGEWTFVTLEISGEGEHVLRWCYRKDDSDDLMDDWREDCAWLDMVSWTGGVPPPVRHETETTPVPVPYAWLDQYPAIMSAAGGDYEAAAKAPTGKRDAAGTPTYVWQDFVAGTDPTNPDDALRAFIRMEDGRPVVTWSPNLNTNGPVRVYKVLGRTSFGDAAGWQSPADLSTHRFFKVCVEMP